MNYGQYRDAADLEARMRFIGILPDRRHRPELRPLGGDGNDNADRHLRPEDFDDEIEWAAGLRAGPPRVWNAGEGIHIPAARDPGHAFAIPLGYRIEAVGHNFPVAVGWAPENFIPRAMADAEAARAARVQRKQRKLNKDKDDDLTED